MCEDGEKVTFKKVNPNIDIEKLKRGEYKLQDVVLRENNNCKTLGQIDGEDIKLKTGKFGVYFTYKGKNKSLKYLNKKIEQITLGDIKKVLEMKPKKSNILKNISDVASVRQGKFGPYIFYKTDKMKKPTFISIKNKAWKDIDMDWIYDNI